MSQKEFAKLLDFTQGYISELERGKCFPSVSFLSRLAENFGQSYNWILTGRETNDGIAKQPEEIKEPPLVISPEEKPDLYILVTILERASESERTRFLDMAVAYFNNKNE